MAAFGDPASTAVLIGQRIRYEETKQRFHVAGFYKRPEVQWLAQNLKPFSREDVAAGVQAVLEETVTKYIRDHISDIPNSQIVLSGGVFANVRLNQVVKELGFRRVFVFPHMGDGGLSWGAACACFAEKNSGEPTEAIKDVYLGTKYNAQDIKATLDEVGVNYHEPELIEKTIAELITEGKVVARFDGRMVYGPRALCNRSILYRADDKTVNDWLNKRLGRTEFMPFAPVILDEEAKQFFFGFDEANQMAMQYMTTTVDSTELCKNVAPAVVHVDGTARPQLVTQESNESMYKILQEYKALRGFSIMVNTSFNMHEEPIVRDPGDAVRAFQSGHLDVLAIGPYIVLKD